MPLHPVKPSAEALALDEDPVAKTARSATEPSIEFKHRLGSLPLELQLNVVRQVAYQPDRLQAHAGLNWLLEDNPRLKDLVENTKNLKESREALGRNREAFGAGSRLVAVCYDVVDGIPVKDAIRQNGPLPNLDKTDWGDLSLALDGATYQHLADLAETFTARGGSTNDEKLLTAVRSIMEYDFRGQVPELSGLNIEQAATFARVFSIDTIGGDSMYALRGLGETVQRYNLVSQATIEQISALADAFGTKDGKNYAQRVASSQPQPPIDLPNMLTQEAERFHTVANEVIETLASHVKTRGDELTRGANSEQHDTMPELLNTMKQVFSAHDSAHDSPICHSAVEKIDALVKNLDPNDRPQLARRERSRSPVGR